MSQEFCRDVPDPGGLQKVCARKRLCASSMNTTNFYHDTAPICVPMLLQKYLGQGSFEHSEIYVPFLASGVWGVYPRRRSEGAG